MLDLLGPKYWKAQKEASCSRIWAMKDNIRICKGCEGEAKKDDDPT